MATQEINPYAHDRRQSNTPRNRFAWVRRLMQGQNRTSASTATVVAANSRTTNSHHRHQQRASGAARVPRDAPVFAAAAAAAAATTTARGGAPVAQGYQTGGTVDEEEEGDTTLRFQEGDIVHHISNSQLHDDYSMSDQNTNFSEDNISTTPLKSIISSQSTRDASILSIADVNNDQTSSLNAALTAQTSLAPSAPSINYTLAHNLNNPSPTAPTAATPTPSNSGNTITIATTITQFNHQNAPERDSESIVTLASSSRRNRRRSIDTNCSTAGIPPASIMERLSIQQTTAAASSIHQYATSIKTSGGGGGSGIAANAPVNVGNIGAGGGYDRSSSHLSKYDDDDNDEVYSGSMKSY